MPVFIAGANITGLPANLFPPVDVDPWPKSHARIQQVNKSSHSPLAILARECAESGAMTAMSAQLRRSMCKIESRREVYMAHSSSASEFLVFDRIKFRYDYTIDAIKKKMSCKNDCTYNGERFDPRMFSNHRRRHPHHLQKMMSPQRSPASSRRHTMKLLYPPSKSTAPPCGLELL